MIEEAAQKGRGVLVGRPGGIVPAHARCGKSAPHRVRGVVVEFLIFFRRAFPVADIGLVPDLPQPGLHFLPAIPLHTVPHPLVNQFAPLVVILGRIGPPQKNIVVIPTRLPMVAIGLGVSGESLRHETDLHQRLHFAIDVTVEDAVGDGPVIDGLARSVLRVSVSGTPLQCSLAIARHQQAVDAHVYGHGTQCREFGQQLAAVLHIGVVRLIMSEERPDRFQRTASPAEVDVDGNGVLAQ